MTKLLPLGWQSTAAASSAQARATAPGCSRSPSRALRRHGRLGLGASARVPPPPLAAVVAHGRHHGQRTALLQRLGRIRAVRKWVCRYGELTDAGVEAHLDVGPFAWGSLNSAFGIGEFACRFHRFQIGFMPHSSGKPIDLLERSPTVLSCFFRSAQNKAPERL